MDKGSGSVFLPDPDPGKPKRQNPTGSGLKLYKQHAIPILHLGGINIFPYSGVPASLHRVPAQVLHEEGGGGGVDRQRGKDPLLGIPLSKVRAYGRHKKYCMKTFPQPLCRFLSAKGVFYAFPYPNGVVGRRSVFLIRYLELFCVFVWLISQQHGNYTTGSGVVLQT